VVKISFFQMSLLLGGTKHQHTVLRKRAMGYMYENGNKVHESEKEENLLQSLPFQI
jgi:hypothetical protein